MTKAAMETQEDAPEASGAPEDASGWELDPRERRDFYHRIRTFPPEVAAWRKRMVEHVTANRDLFPAIPPDATLEDVRTLIDEGISYLREIARILAVLHRTPRLGNKDDAVDELVYIILSRKTREGAYQEAFEKLKQAFPSWDDLLAAPPEEVEELIYSSGLSEKKTVSLFAALEKLWDTFGSCTLEPAREWPDDKLEEFLCSLPEIQRKSAYCIMMFAFGRQVFPVDTHVGRTLARLGPYRELGLDLDGLDHKQLQKVLADLVPPNLRYSLHVNLLTHGREICRAQRPLCDHCELRQFCKTYRRNEVVRLASSDAPTVVDLFSGAGGLSEGFSRAGFRILLALDSDPVALRTYWLNHPGVPDNRILCRDIRGLDKGEIRRLVGPKPLDVLIGAPPCQGFSHAGFRSKSAHTGYKVTSDERNYLFEFMVGTALELKPRLFLMENVPGMKSAKRENLSFIEAAAKMLEDGGKYRTAIWKLNAAALGVPQDRIRYFLVASREGGLPSRPAGEYQDQQQELDVDALPPVTLEEAIFDLPPRTAGSGHAVDRWEPPDPKSTSKARRYLSKFNLLSGSPLLYNHTVRYHNERDLELYALLRPGEDSIHALERHGAHDLMRYRRDVFDDKYARLRGDRPCKTIVAHLAKDGNGYIHPTQVRSLSFREAARVQSFHDGYIFCGSPSDQWTHLGNAVPPVLAEAIARSFLRTLRNGNSR